MPNLNYVVVCGHLSRDPDMRFTTNGTATCKLNVAVNTGFGDKRKAHFIDVKCWNKTAEYIGAKAKKGLVQSTV